jgi:hypothetical protein
MATTYLVKQSTMEKKLVIAIHTYQDDGWYGKRRRYYYEGPDGLGFKNKTEAKKYESKLKKYIKSILKSKEELNGTEIGEFDNMITYKYMGAGPSLSIANIKINQL